MVELEGVHVIFGGLVHALDEITFTIRRGEIVGLVGESGSGKTTLCRVVAGLTPASSGEVRVSGQSVPEQLASNRLAFRRRTQMLLQDAVASLSPRMTVGRSLLEAIQIHNLPRATARTRLATLLQRLGLQEELLSKYPHQISGGQARRVSMARALIIGPEFIIADEPTAGLDVSVQGDLLNLLLDLQKEFHLTYLLVSHNLNVIRRVTQRMAVMYLGQIVEEGRTRDVFASPGHPYTASLISTNPAIDPARRLKRIVLRGEIPSVVERPSGCRFHTRCPIAQPRCSVEEPAWREARADHWVRCHYAFSLDPRSA